MLRLVCILLASLVHHACAGNAYMPETHQAARLIVYSELLSNDNKLVDDRYVSVNYGRTAGSRQDVYTLMNGDEIKSYKPAIFRQLRGYMGISEKLYQSCLNPDFLECLSDKTDSKSGQAFWRYTL